MPRTQIMEIEMSRLQPNTYNPRKTMDKTGLASLTSSLERDGQLQTILVRPIDGDKYEVVAGMRRYIALKNLGTKKVTCTVQEMDDDTAMQRAFKENLEREQMSAIDEANWFFKMLKLKEEQLFIHAQGTKGTDFVELHGVLPLPSEINPDVIDLAKKIGIKPDRIADRHTGRLQLLALPENLQQQVGKDDGITIQKAVVLSRLRLIGDKEEAHKQMLALWKSASDVDVNALNARVNTILEDYAKRDEELFNDLKGQRKDILEYRTRINERIKEISDWIDPKSEAGLFKQLPKLVADKLKVTAPKEMTGTYLGWANSHYNRLDELIQAITKDESLSDLKTEVDHSLDNLVAGKEDLKDNDECAYCASHVNSKHLEDCISEVKKEKETILEDIKTKDKLRNDMEKKMKRPLGEQAQNFRMIAERYDGNITKLIESGKLTEDKAEKDWRKVLLLKTED